LWLCKNVIHFQDVFRPGKHNFITLGIQKHRVLPHHQNSHNKIITVDYTLRKKKDTKAVNWVHGTLSNGTSLYLKSAY